jgi:hypothetical protein
MVMWASTTTWGPGIRPMTLGEMTYVLPEKTIIYRVFEILPVDLRGPSLMPVKRP